MAGSGIDRKTIWNVVAVAVLLIIVLAIGVFIGKTMSMNDKPGPTAVPTATPGPADATAQPSPASTATPTAYVTLTPTPTPAPYSTATPTPTPMPTPTPTPAPTLTPTPTATPYPTQSPQPTPTPTPQPTEVPDTPFYESITPLKEKDRFSLAPVENTYQAGNGPLYLDLGNSYMGSGWAYPGDTIGVKLKMYNDGPALNTDARVTMSLSKFVITPYGSFWADDIIPVQQFTTPISVGSQSSFTKNLSYTVPNITGIKGFYRITVKFYVNDQFNCGFVKQLNILDP